MSFSVFRVKLATAEHRVFNPSTARRLEPGEVYKVPRAPYWLRAIASGAVVEVEDAPPPPPKMSGKKKGDE